MDNRVIKVFTILPIVLSITGMALFIYSGGKLTHEILGIPTLLLGIGLFISGILVIWGWGIVKWFSRRGD